MEKNMKPVKISAVMIATAIVAVLHYAPAHGHAGVHIIHRELFTIPILLAGFWFGLKTAMAVSVGISAIYAPQMVLGAGVHADGAAVFAQIVFFNVVAFLIGFMVERQKKQREKLIVAEKLAVLGRAASAMAHEIKDIVNALKKSARDAGDFACTELDSNFHGELRRLDRLVDNLTAYVPREEIRALSKDLNLSIRKSIEKNREKARQAGVSIESELDGAGCPTMVDADKIGWVLDILIRNALEHSSAGQTIWIGTSRKGSHCEVLVKDQGAGIKPEHLSKIFQPFFTTKKNGSGLSLASCKKNLRDMGGDIRVSSALGKGTVFTLVVPREKKDKPYRERVLAVEKAMVKQEKRIETGECRAK